MSKISGKTTKVPYEAQDFQPDAIELENHQPPVSMHFAWFVIISALIFLVIWASFTKVDKIVTADGKIVTERPPITMKPLDRTTIRDIKVEVGDRVQKGDILYVFDQTVNQQELNRLYEQLRSLRAEEIRLLAEQDGYDVPPVFENMEDEDAQRQMRLFLTRKAYFEDKMKAYEETIARYEKTISSQEETLVLYQDRLGKLGEIQAKYEYLQSIDAVSETTLLATESDVLATEIQVENHRLSILENRQQVLTVAAERDAFLSDWNRQIAQSLVEVERSITSYEREIPKYEMFVKETEMRAPCDAIVHEMAPFQEGSAVREAEALITLIPVDSENYYAEIDIPARDISWVSTGDVCRLKLDAFPFQQCGTLDGEILYISQDAFKRDTASMQERVRNDDGGIQSEASRGISYQARLRISGELTGRGTGAELLPGMRLRAEIKVGERRVISYIFNPFLKAFDEAIREP